MPGPAPQAARRPRDRMMQRDLPSRPRPDAAAAVAAANAPPAPAPALQSHRGRLFRKYLLLILSLVTTVLLVSSGINLYFSYRENRAALASLQHEKAVGAASRIEQYIRQVSQQLGYASLPQLDAGDVEARRIEFLKLLRQAPEVTDIAQLDATGREQIAVSRLGMDIVASARDRSAEPAFLLTRRGQPWYGPVYFRKETEPYMTVAIRSGGEKSPVTVAEVNLKFIWDVVSRIKIGVKGKAYVVDAGGLLIADPDIGLVLRKTSLAELPHLKAAAGADANADAPSMASHDLAGTPVLASMVPIEPLAWKVFVEQPIAEVYAKLDASIARTGALLLAGLVISALAASALARGMVRPIRTLDAGARRIGAGELDQLIVVRTGDELEGLADQFNRMTAQLRESYAGLERKVEQRTIEVTEALDYQTAISDVLRVISETPTDVGPVFEAIMDSARRLFGTSIAAVFRFDGSLVHLVATRDWSAQALEDARRLYPGPPNPALLSGRVILSGRVQTIVDAHADASYDRDTANVGQWRRMIGAPMLKDGMPVGTLVVAWPDPGETPQRQADLLRTFADQAVIAIENVRLISETKEALEQQKASAEILRVISSSVADTNPVFDAIVDACGRLFEGQFIGINLIDEHGGLCLRASHAPADKHFAVQALAQHTEQARERTAGTRLKLRGEVIDFPDVEAGADVPDEVREGCRIGGSKAIAFAPMVSSGKGIGSIWVARDAVGSLPAQVQALLKTFADQAVIAIQNSRLFNETKEALERQTATAQILRVISGSPTNLQPVLDAVAERSGLLCRAEGSRVWLLEGGHLRAMTSYGRSYPADSAGALLPLLRSSVAGRAFLEHRCVHVEDIVPLIDTEYPDVRDFQARHGFRSMLAVPLLREGASVGVISLLRNEVRAFTPTEINLVQTFADQAVIAIENVRLFSETREALEQQTATAEILQVISRSPTDVQPVFDAIAERAMTLCEAMVGGVTRFDGELVHLVAFHGASAEAPDAMRAAFPMPVGRGAITARAILERVPVQIADVLSDPDYALNDATRLAGCRSNLAVPMLREGRVIGSIGVCRAQPGLFPAKQIRLLQTFADQAVIAIENVRLFNETREALEQQTATAAILQVISSSVADAKPVFAAILASCERLFAGLHMGISLVGDDGAVHLAEHRGPAADRAAFERSFPVPLSLESGSGVAILTRQVAHYPDVEAPDVPLHVRLSARPVNTRSVAIAPLLWDGRGIGVIFVGRGVVGAFSDKDISLLKTFADQAVIAIQNARLFHEIGDKSRQLELANKHKSEFLANMSHELRTPLNAIIGFSEVLTEQMFGDMNAKQLEYVQDIHSSGQHLLMLINDVLDLSKIEAGRMELDLSCFDLGLLLENSLTLVRERATRHGLTLALEVGTDIDEWVADQRKVKQVVVNLLSNAVKFTPTGGKVTLRVRRVVAIEGGAVEIAVVDTGVGIAADQQAVVFEEFRQASGSYLRKSEGTGLGLALAKRFVELHGGTIRVESAPGQGSTFAFTLPSRALEVE